jgi:hypothetical protein
MKRTLNRAPFTKPNGPASANLKAQRAGYLPERNEFSTIRRRTVVHSESVMEFAFSEVDPERIMIGGNYCLDMGYEQPGHFLDQLNITSAQR